MQGKIDGQVPHLAHIKVRGGVALQADQRLVDIAFIGHVQHVAEDGGLDLADVHLAHGVLVVGIFLAGAREHQRFRAVEVLVLPLLHGDVLGR